MLEHFDSDTWAQLANPHLYLAYVKKQVSMSWFSIEIYQKGIQVVREYELSCIQSVSIFNIPPHLQLTVSCITPKLPFPEITQSLL